VQTGEGRNDLLIHILSIQMLNLARSSVLSTCGVLKIFSILLTKTLLGPASHLAACSDASIQEQL
jgi:hypothetical protein